MCLWKVEVDINCFRNDQKQRAPCRGRERIRSDSRDIRQCCPERRSNRKGNAKTCPYQCHGTSALTLIADIRRNRIGNLHIPLTQTANDATTQKSSKVRSSY